MKKKIGVGMDRDLKLKEKYPKILKNLGGDPAITCMSDVHGGINIGDGWIPLLENLFSFCQFNTDNNGYPQVVADQIKEKFGTLRFYCHFKYTETTTRGEEMLEGAIYFAESITNLICEKCGKPGTINSEGWSSVLCEDCRNG